MLARFDAEMRFDPPREVGVRYERVRSVLRAVGNWNAIVYASLTENDADAIIAEQVAFFRVVAREPAPAGTEAGAQALEWKVYGHDLPADLGSRLAAAGFEPDEPETLMVFDLRGGLREETRSRVSRAGIAVRRVVDPSGLTDAMTAAAAAFGRDTAWQTERTSLYSARLGDPAAGFYVAYADGRPVASARAEFTPGRSFAGLWGGGTVPEYRGRGIYRSLVHTRAEEARRRGYRYLRVDARETSRPILERLGFIALTHVVEWRLPLPIVARPS